jgi:hypothetical protein
VRLEACVGVSLLWGEPRWGRWLARGPAERSARWLARADGVARRWPGWADVLVLAGPPRRRARPSA